MFLFCILEFCLCLFLDLCAFLAWFSGYNFSVWICLLYWSSTTSPDLISFRHDKAAQSNRNSPLLHNNRVERGAARRDDRRTIVPSRSTRLWEDITVSVCLQEKKQKSFLKLKDWIRQSSWPTQKGIAAPEGAKAPVTDEGFQARLKKPRFNDFKKVYFLRFWYESFSMQ